MFAGYPIYWCSKLQTEIALSTTEAEYIALLHAMCGVLPFLNSMKEVHDVFPFHDSKPNFYCKVIEDNCIKVAENTKFMHRTKYKLLKYHHFELFVSDGTF